MKNIIDINTPLQLALAQKMLGKNNGTTDSSSDGAYVIRVDDPSFSIYNTYDFVNANETTFEYTEAFSVPGSLVFPQNTITFPDDSISSEEKLRDIFHKIVIEVHGVSSDEVYVFKPCSYIMGTLIAFGFPTNEAIYPINFKVSLGHAVS